jgi:hypothetical protein
MHPNEIVLVQSWHSPTRDYFLLNQEDMSLEKRRAFKEQIQRQISFLRLTT